MQLRPVHVLVGLLGRVLVERLPARRRRLQLRRRDLVEEGQLALDVRVVDLREVLVVGGLDRALVEQEVEVRRVREVLKPVGKAGLSGRLGVSDRREVDAVADDLRRRLEADLVQDAGVVLDVLAARAALLAPDGHRRTDHYPGKCFLGRGFLIGALAALAMASASSMVAIFRQSSVGAACFVGR